MWHWLHHLFNPHCPICLDNAKDDKVCQSCEILKHQLELANLQIDKLVNKITEKPEVVVRNDSPPIMTKPKMIPWAVRRQMLEAEDRAKATAMRNAGQPDINETTTEKEDVAELEKELNLAATERASNS